MVSGDSLPSSYRYRPIRQVARLTAGSKGRWFLTGLERQDPGQTRPVAPWIEITANQRETAITCRMIASRIKEQRPSWMRTP